ncbi:hypothetical protein [Serratia marcescens]|uniref:hypothetical protein n=1 Tax=Serratia marcescens TaxID=615 RepID=UPI001650ABF6|nr:hypothetical protein [Serratia marcescens]
MTTIKRFTPDYKMHAVRFEAFAREAEHGEYVKFDAHQRAVSALEAERDALADRVERLSGMLTESRVATKSAEERADALAVENAAMRGVIDAAVGVANNSSGIAGWHLNGEIADWDEILPELNIEAPATDAALAAIEARGVEKLIKLKMEQLANMHPDTHAFGATAESLRAQINDLQAFATELREAK